MVMTPEGWTVIGIGVVILIAIATSHRHLRAEMNEKMNGLHGRMDQLQADRSIHSDTGADRSSVQVPGAPSPSRSRRVRGHRLT